ncbi:MAG: hypothetical protein H5U03_07550 [Clostridia bacterium]|nr:hypothetical protein [Clostridia bacterium]
MTVLQAWYFTGVYYSALEDGFNAFTAVYPGTLPDIFEDDEVRVCGWIGPKFEGVNVYGAVVRQPAIMAVYVDKHVRPTPRPTPTPVVYGMNEPVTIDGWVAKLYDVKKVKAVYFYDDAYIAKGYFLLVFVEFTNNTGGTAYPGELGWRLLDKKAGITRLPEFPAKATWYASWQYQSGRLYGDIQPGSVLGVVEAWDLPPDTGDLYLVADAAPGVAIYLGNFSQLPESR